MQLAFGCAAGGTDKPQGEDPGQEQEPPVEDLFFAKGADIGWITEMEDKGYQFYNANGTKRECTMLMKELGFNAIRHRVWVNPADGYCGKEDLLNKCLRAKKLGLKLMIDFHYSDSWADPGKQNPPAAWKNYNLSQMCEAVSQHTTEILQMLKDNGIDVPWVQVGNETRTGMLKPVGELSSTSNKNFCSLVNAGYDAVKTVYPEALVILHNDNAWNLSQNDWFYGQLKSGGARYDMIGLSLYPSYWDKSINAYPDWNDKVKKAVTAMPELNKKYGKPVMLVEWGMPASEAEKSKEALQYLMDNLQDHSWFKGIFYWEPESEKARNGYDYGAFAGGKATVALDPFKN